MHWTDPHEETDRVISKLRNVTDFKIAILKSVRHPAQKTSDTVSSQLLLEALKNKKTIFFSIELKHTFQAGQIAIQQAYRQMVMRRLP